jgi:hypothetical protein
LNSIVRVGNLVANIAFEEAREIAKSLENLRTTDEIEETVSRLFLKNWSHLFTEKDLPLRSAR